MTKLWTAESAYSNRADENDKRRVPIFDAANRLVKEYSRLGMVDPRQKIEEVRGVLYYRDLWPYVVADIDEAFRSIDPSRNCSGRTTMRSNGLIEPSAGGCILTASPLRSWAGSLPEDWSVSGPSRITSATGGGREFGVAVVAVGSLAPVILHQEINGPKAFLIDVRGSSPSADTDKMLVNNIIPWLAKHAKVAGRPYEIVVNDKKYSYADRQPMGPIGGRGAPGPGGDFAPPPALG